MWSSAVPPNDVATPSIAELPEFVSRVEVALVYLRLAPLPPFNAALLRALPVHLRETTSAAQAEFKEVLTNAPEYAMFLGDALACLGVPNQRVVLPGYYLFRAGKLCSWHIGGPDKADLPRYIMAGMLGWISSRATGLPRLPWMALQYVNEVTAAERMAVRFSGAVGSGGEERGSSWHDWAHSQRDARSADFQATDAAIAQAYATLGVTPDMTDSEIRRAFRRRCRDCHPDLRDADPVERERRTRELQRINAAYELLERVRGVSNA